MFIIIISFKEDVLDLLGFLRGFLFDNIGIFFFELFEFIFNVEEFLKAYNEVFIFRRYGVLFLDYLYIMEIELERNFENDGES